MIKKLNFLKAKKVANQKQSRLVFAAQQIAARINFDAVLSTVLTGELFGDLMPFDGVSDIAFTPNNSLTETAANRCSVALGARTQDLYSEYDEILRQAIRSVPEEISTVMGISGGRDSRHIALAIRACGRTLPNMVSSRHFIGNLSEADVAVAQKIGLRLGQDVQIANQPGDRFRQEWDKNRITGLQTLAHSWGLALANALKGPEMLFDGMNGGVLFGRGGLQQSLLRRFGKEKPSAAVMRQHVLSELVDKPFSALQAWLPSKLTDHELVDNIRQRLAKCFSQYEDFENPIQAFLHGEHVRRNTRLFTYGIMENEYVVCPLDTEEMVSFALSLPWPISTDPKFQDQAIAYKYPDFDDIPYAESLGRLPVMWMPDKLGESSSWQSIRRVLCPHLSEIGLKILDETRHQLGVIQRATLLAQVFYWEDQGSLPDAALFFREHDNSEDHAGCSIPDTKISPEPAPAACATYSIEQVILDHERDDLVATVVSDASRKGQFAFYLFRNDERIHTQWYSSNPAMRFPIQSEPGLYRVLAFLLSPNGSKITKYSNPLILSPAVDAQGQAFKKA